MINKGSFFNIMLLKQINPEDLVKGKKYLVELEYRKTTDSKNFPLKFTDDLFGDIIVPIMQPIYTHESSTDIDLEMHVNVASRIYTDTLRNDSIDECVNKAQRLITACKNQLKQQP